MQADAIPVDRQLFCVFTEEIDLPGGCHGAEAAQDGLDRSVFVFGQPDADSRDPV